MPKSSVTLKNNLSWTHQHLYKKKPVSDVKLMSTTTKFYCNNFSESSFFIVEKVISKTLRTKGSDIKSLNKSGLINSTKSISSKKYKNDKTQKKEACNFKHSLKKIAYKKELPSLDLSKTQSGKSNIPKLTNYSKNRFEDLRNKNDFLNVRLNKEKANNCDKRRKKQEDKEIQVNFIINEEIKQSIGIFHEKQVLKLKELVDNLKALFQKRENLFLSVLESKT